MDGQGQAEFNQKLEDVLLLTGIPQDVFHRLVYSLNEAQAAERAPGVVVPLIPLSIPRVSFLLPLPSQCILSHANGNLRSMY